MNADNMAEFYGHLPVHTEHTAVILRDYLTGDERTWDEEAADIDITDLLTDVRRDGRIIHPITLGDDGRVLDGHHRVLVARALRIAEVPVRFAHLKEPA